AKRQVPCQPFPVLVLCRDACRRGENLCAMGPFERGAERGGEGGLLPAERQRPARLAGQAGPGEGQGIGRTISSQFLSYSYSPFQRYAGYFFAHRVMRHGFSRNRRINAVQQSRNETEAMYP